MADRQILRAVSCICTKITLHWANQDVVQILDSQFAMMISRKPQVLRLWPAVLLVVAQIVAQLTGVPFGPKRLIHGWIAFVIWWLLFSAIPIRERAIGFIALLGIGILPRLTMHSSMHFVIFSYVVPSVLIVLVAAWLLSTRVRWQRRRWIGLGSALSVMLAWNLVRVDGVSGDLVPDFQFRWSESTEQAFLDRPYVASSDLNSTQPLVIADHDRAPRSEPWVSSSGAKLFGVKESVHSDWPGFRGPARNSHVSIQHSQGADFRNWGGNLPQEVWRRRVGPAWSSFAVVGDRLVTQEQRGAWESVVCYQAGTGAELWIHRDEVRFDTMLAGVGPRATPSISGQRVITVGATGIVNCLSLADGKQLWQHQLPTDEQSGGLPWGFSCSPLIYKDNVFIYAGAGNDVTMAAHRIADGERLWSQGSGQPSYSSPHLATLQGYEQLLMFTGMGLESFDPASGAVLWSYAWPTDGTESRIIQPTVVSGESLLLGTESKSVRLSVTRSDGWHAREVWSSRNLKPAFSDGVVYEGHAYGFDGSLLCCVDLVTGERCWRKRGYGKGQMLLISDEGLLLVLSETGMVAVVEASPIEFHELSRIQVLTGKSWNHPVVCRGRMYLRNSAEAACFVLPKSRVSAAGGF